MKSTDRKRLEKRDTIKMEKGRGYPAYPSQRGSWSSTQSSDFSSGLTALHHFLPLQACKTDGEQMSIEKEEDDA